MGHLCGERGRRGAPSYRRLGSVARVGVCASAHARGSDAPAVWTPRALPPVSLVDEAGAAVVFRGSCAGDTAQWVSQNG
eukprot:COSAG01_NODE_10571_length_2129_cov_4.778376_3_plen_79_part_00